jgi:SGF29 tudor-like domain
MHVSRLLAYISTSHLSQVIRLLDDANGIGKGDDVLAVFPNTTSFYPGVVHRVGRPSSVAADHWHTDAKAGLEVSSCKRQASG